MHKMTQNFWKGHILDNRPIAVELGNDLGESVRTVLYYTVTDDTVEIPLRKSAEQSVLMKVYILRVCSKIQKQLEMWANAQRDGRPAEYRWRPLLNAAVWPTPTTRMPCSNAAKTGKPLKLAGVPQTTGSISAANGPKFTILWGHVDAYCCLTSFFRLSIRAVVAKI